MDDNWGRLCWMTEIKDMRKQQPSTLEREDMQMPYARDNVDYGVE